MDIIYFIVCICLFVIMYINMSLINKTKPNDSMNKDQDRTKNAEFKWCVCIFANILLSRLNDRCTYIEANDVDRCCFQ